MTRSNREPIRTGRLALAGLAVLALALGTLALLMEAGAPAAKKRSKPSVLDDWGGTHARWPGVRTVAFEPSYGGKKKGGTVKLRKYPVSIDTWGMYLGVPSGFGSPFASCDDGGGAGATIPKELSLRRQEFVTGNADLAFGPELPVRKRRFSHRDSYDVPLQNGTMHIDYTLSGRFRSRQRVVGTVDLTVVGSFVDGRVVTCRSGPVAWSACPGDLDPEAKPKPCLGIDPGIATGEAEPLIAQSGE